MIVEKMESVLTALKKVRAEQIGENYLILKAATGVLREAIDQVRHLEATALGDTKVYE